MTIYGTKALITNPNAESKFTAYLKVTIDGMFVTILILNLLCTPMHNRLYTIYFIALKCLKINYWLWHFVNRYGRIIVH